MMNSLTKRTYYTMSDCEIVLQELVENNPASMKLADLLTTKYEYNWIVFSDVEVRYEDVTANIDANKVNQWKNRFTTIYNETKNRYVKLITLYLEQEDNLLNRVSSSSTTKFNDTPQNVGVGETDDYTSTVSKVSTEVDPGEMIDRINNIHNKYKDLEAEWIREFDDLFGESTL